MSWTDHHFNQSKFGRRWTNHPLWQVVAGAVPLGSVGGVRIRAHASLLWCIGAILLYAGFNPVFGWKLAFTSVGTLVMVLLLHEWGHCFASVCTGGKPDEIILWPLGGLTTHGAPRRSGATFAVALGGPMVNGVICAFAITALLALRARGMGLRELWYPLHRQSYLLPFHGAAFYVGWVFRISWILLLANLLPILPLDGGRVAHAIFWGRLGFYRGFNITCLLGMVGSVSLIAGGLVPPVRWALIGLGAILYLHCLQQRQVLRHLGAEGALDEGDEPSGTSTEPQRRRRRKLSRRLIIRARRRAERDRAELERVDVILAKVSAQGIRSLTWLERRVLHKATERQRECDVDLLDGPRSA
jgi:Zn-dependent protease